MSNTPKIDEVLKGKVHVEAQENTDCYVDPTCKAIFDTPKLKSELCQLILEVIGDIDLNMWFIREAPLPDDPRAIVQKAYEKGAIDLLSKLRQEQRQKLNNLFGKDK